MNQISPYKSAYRSEIDGLRAFAVLSVVAFHAFPSWLKGGFIGVDVFFVISGFLITSHIFENLDKGQFSFTDFFSRRIRRIFPALILVMACSLVFGWFTLLADEFAQLSKHVASGAAFITNFILVDESGYFDNAAETKPMLHLWSLAVEEQFYIVWPLMLWLAWKNKFNLLTITILVAVVSFYLNLRFVKSHPTEIFFWPVGRLWELLSGSVLAWLLLYKSDMLSRLKLWVDKFVVRIIHSKEVEADGSTTSNLMSFIGMFLLVYGVLRVNESLPFPSKWALIPVLGAVLIIASGSKAWLNRIFLMNPIAVWFGLISYPLYLWHWPILSFLQIVEGEIPHRDARILAVLLSIFLAWVTYRFIEQPIRVGSKLGFKSILLLVLMATTAFFSLVVLKYDGLSIRHGEFDSPQPWKDVKCHGGKSISKFENPLVECLGAVSNGKGGDIFLIGDSHAAQFTFPIIDYSLGKGVDFNFINTEDRSDIPYAMWLSDDVSDNRIIKHLFNISDRGDLIVFAFHRGRLNDARDAHIPLGKSLQINGKEERFYKSFNSIKDKFISKGVRFVFLLDSPLLPNKANVQLCAVSNYLIRKVKAECKINFEQDTHTRTRQERVFHKILLDNPNHVFVLDPLPSLYGGADNYVPYDIQNGKYLMFDRHHLTEYGALQVSDFIGQELDKINNK
ncbi:acyltransferase family protein [Vibrio metoecus]|uniref:Acyltransferase n=1 Tax=Vibrio metoecus TaxID=1481663 RepID=A0A271VRL6_VIBMT|nr:acyltransferase family protein [Vibrio metoecus]PAR20656.1 acyltransferase [Vibrio metoecus]PAR23522.1 acyltransferase [Vibrio metoecus]